MNQTEFDDLVRVYNDQLHRLLKRAGRKEFDNLLRAFIRLKDFYCALVELQSVENYLFRVLPYPLSFRANADLLRKMGFDEGGIRNIFGFLEFVKETEGKEFEAVLDEMSQHRNAGAS